MAYLVALLIAVFLGGVVSGLAGFAFSAVAGAILLHFLKPMQAIPLMMLCSIVAQLMSLVMMRKHLAWKESTPLLIGGFVGVPIALLLLTLVEPRAFRIAFGVALVGYALYMLARPAVRIANAAGAAVSSAVGFAGGLIGGLTAMPGALPVIWCELRGLAKEHQRGLVQPYILAMQAFAIALLLAQPGAISRDLLIVTAAALPATVAGTFVGMALFGKVDSQRFRLVVLLLLLISGGLMIR
jgi:uncharacterized membrane protein YfcA